MNFKQSIKSLKLYKSKYLLLFTFLTFIFSILYLVLNHSVNLYFGQDFKDFSSGLSDQRLSFGSIVRTVVIPIIVLFIIFVFSAVDYILKIRASEFSVLRIIVGLNKKYVIKKIKKENIILVILSSLLAGLLSSLIYPIVNDYFTNNILNLPIQLSNNGYFFSIYTIQLYALTTLIIILVFSFTFKYKFKKITILEHVNAQRSFDHKKTSVNITLQDILKLILSIVVFTIVALISKNIGTNVIQWVPVLLFVGYYINQIFVYSLFKITLTILKKNKRFNSKGLNAFTTGQLYSNLKGITRLCATTIFSLGACFGIILVSQTLLKSSDSSKYYIASSNVSNKDQMAKLLKNKKIKFNIKKVETKLTNDAKGFIDINNIKGLKVKDPKTARFSPIKNEKGETTKYNLDSIKFTPIFKKDREIVLKATNHQMFNIYAVSKKRLEQINAKNIFTHYVFEIDKNQKNITKKLWDIKTDKEKNRNYYYTNTIKNFTNNLIILVLMMFGASLIFVQIGIVSFKYTQLAWDDIGKYIILKNIGVTKNKIIKSIKLQTYLVLIIPLIFSLLQSIYLFEYIFYPILKNEGNINISQIVNIAMIFSIIYIIFMWINRKFYTNIILKSKNNK